MIRVWCWIVGHRWSGWSNMKGTAPPFRVCNRCGKHHSPYVWAERD